MIAGPFAIGLQTLLAATAARPPARLIRLAASRGVAWPIWASSKDHVGCQIEEFQITVQN